MDASPDGNKVTLDASTLKAEIHQALGNLDSGQRRKTRVKPKRGSKKYLHLQKFIEMRREKKLQRRCTLDPSAQVTFLIERCFDNGDDDDNHNDDDDDDDDCRIRA